MKCSKCDGTGILEVMHGEDSSEWIEEFACDCDQDLNEGICR